MAWIDEILAAEGITDPVERRARTAELVRGPREETTVGGALTGALGEVGAARPLSGLREKLGRQIQEVPTIETPAASATFGGRVEAQPEAPELMFRPQTPLGGEPGQPPLATPPGAGGGPSLRPLQEAIGARREARPGMQAALEAPYEQRQAAVTQQTEVAEQVAYAEAETRRFNQLKWETEVAEQQEREAQRTKRVEGEFNQIRTMIADIEKSGIDPKRLYKHPDGSNNYGKSILAAVAVGMGALAQSRMGGPNNAMNIINRAIDRDIDAQKTNLANRRAGVGLQMNLLGRMQSQFASERQYEAATRMTMLKTAEMEVTKNMAAWKGPAAQANGQVLLASIEQEKTKAATEFQKAGYNQTVSDEATMLGARQKQAAVRATQQAAVAKAAPPAMPPGMKLADPTAAMPTKDDFKRAKVMTGAHRNVSRLIQDLLAWREEYGAEILDRSALAIANTKLQRVKSAMRKVDETGARLDAGELEMMGLDFTMGGVGYVKERLQTVLGSVGSKIEDALYPMNIMPSGTGTAAEGFRPAGATQ